MADVMSKEARRVRDRVVLEPDRVTNVSLSKSTIAVIVTHVM